MIKHGDKKYQITLNHLNIGEDLLVIITGGKEHIGAVSLVDNSKLLNLTKVGHKDDAISKVVAPLISKSIKQDVLVICGIHLDNATKKDIEILTQNVNSCVDEFLLSYKDKK